jgi:rhodanese-related sulfurtransferase
MLRLRAEGAHVIEVLPRAEYEWKHIAGAANLPLEELDEATAAERLDRDRPVITYCNDFQ